jgi:DNA-directed RNA polymerase subunit K
MDEKLKEKFTKYEIARIIGARALQIAMDAPLLLKIKEDELKEIRYDSLKISEKEFESGALPITIHRPTPRKGAEKLSQIKEEKISDEELAEKEKEVEKEIAEDAKELGFANEDDLDEDSSSDSSEEQ